MSFDRRTLMGGAGAGLLASLLPQVARAVSGSRPNLILFFPDELRADALACYGNPVTRTPTSTVWPKRARALPMPMCNIRSAPPRAARC
jgi:choline-sulfatase